MDIVKINFYRVTTVIFFKIMVLENICILSRHFFFLYETLNLSHNSREFTALNKNYNLMLLLSRNMIKRKHNVY